MKHLIFTVFLLFGVTQGFASDYQALAAPAAPKEERSYTTIQAKDQLLYKGQTWRDVVQEMLKSKDYNPLDLNTFSMNHPTLEKIPSDKEIAFGSMGILHRSTNDLCAARFLKNMIQIWCLGKFYKTSIELDEPGYVEIPIGLGGISTKQPTTDAAKQQRTNDIKSLAPIIFKAAQYQIIDTLILSTLTSESVFLEGAGWVDPTPLNLEKNPQLFADSLITNSVNSFFDIYGDPIYNFDVHVKDVDGMKKKEGTKPLTKTEMMQTLCVAELYKKALLDMLAFIVPDQSYVESAKTKLNETFMNSVTTKIKAVGLSTKENQQIQLSTTYIYNNLWQKPTAEEYGFTPNTDPALYENLIKAQSQKRFGRQLPISFTYLDYEYIPGIGETDKVIEKTLNAPTKGYDHIDEWWRYFSWYLSYKPGHAGGMAFYAYDRSIIFFNNLKGYKRLSEIYNFLKAK